MARQSLVAVWVVMLGALSLGAAGCGGDGPGPSEDMGAADGATERCDVASDCPQSACAVATCVSQLCVITPVADGPAPAAAQTAGDCEQVMCLSGTVRSDDDDTDLPAGNACATGTCDGGVAVLTPEPLGQACDENGGTVCNGDNVAPACVGCNAPADCTALPEDDECQTRTCVAHVCGQDFADAGTPLALQAPRDCEELQCDGEGGVVSATLSSDLPDDLNDCTDDSCDGNTPQFTLRGEGAECGDGTLTCSAAGQCMGCADPEECGDDTFCAANTCTAGVCGRTFATAGSVAPTGLQDPGDCQALVCDGEGGLTPIVEDTDFPEDDGDECTVQTCVDGAPMFPPALIDSPCASGGSYCDGSGACVGCNSGTQCGTDTACVQFVCVTHACAVVVAPVGTAIPSGNQIAGDCQELACGSSGGTQSTADNTDVPVDGNDCTADRCTAGVPSNPPTNAGGTCGLNGSQMCDAAGHCQSCFQASDCTGSTFCAPMECISGTCMPQPVAQGIALPSEDQMGGDCQQLQCDGAGDVMSAADNGDLPPDDTNECTQPACNAGTPSTASLQTGSTCNGGADVCDGSGTCVECNADAECGTSTACHLFQCVNHQCQEEDVDAGTVIPTQTAGDCRQVQCNGTGGTMSQPLNSDLPNDQNACTADTCNAGSVQHTITPNASCGSMGVCNAGGQCVGCNTATDCGTDTFCRAYACVANVCQVNDVVANTALPAASQVAADCLTVVCDGGGGTTVTTNPLDVPVEDGNECTVSACSGSTPVQNPNSLGVPCNGGLDLCNGAGTCVDCLAASDCGFDTFCAQFACVNNTCQQTNTAVGTDLPAGNQTALDCKVVECDGGGGERIAALNTDVPVDGNACTQDVCMAGTPSNPPAAVNATCSANGGTRCDGGGQCVQCNTPAHCGTNTFCQTYTCTAGTCGTAPTTVGVSLPGQTAGDCQEMQCNGTGGTRSVANDQDVPNDNNQCTDDMCSLGVPSNPDRVVNTSCSEDGGTYCNGAGSCVECNAGGQCGTNTFCAQFACTTGQCVETDTAVGVDLPSGSQSIGDCQVLECDGAGAIRSVAFNTDVRSDGNACTQDVCTAGVPSNPNRPLNYVCRSGDYCDGAGTCVDCNSADQCGTDSFCRAYTCNSKTCGQVETTAGTDLPAANQTTGDCQVRECDGLGAPRSVALNSDVFVDGIACTDDLCTAGVPSNPNTAMGASCTMGGRYCDGGGSCLECLTDAQCGTTTFCHTYTCNNGTCEESFASAGSTLPTGQTANDCRSLQCNGTGGVVSNPFNTDLPNDANACTNDTCVAGTPTYTNVTNGNACGMAGMCLNGGCVGCVQASNCGTSNFCVTYTCNNNSCEVAYTANGTPLPGQVAGNCQRLECDGAGATVSRAFDSDLPVDGNTCTQDICTAGAPSNPPQALNFACGTGDFCNGAGACVDCNSATQCGTATFCQSFTCNSNTCATVNVAAGVDLPDGDQTAGNCRLLECNGSGGTMNSVADSDLPNDGRQCTTDTCVSGTPTYTNVAINTACGTGDFCNATGTCVDCNTASQCGTTTFCQVFSCNSNTCSTANTANGTALPAGSQVAGDCREVRCNGVGGTTNPVLVSDVPVDANACTDNLCSVGGTPSNPNSAINTACGSGDFCNGAGSCVDCNSAAQCPQGNGSGCQSATCNSNSCGLSNTTAGIGCNDNLYCTLTDQCNGSGSCNGSGARCNTQCQTCNEGTDACNNVGNGTGCSDGAYCTSGDSCQNGSCSSGGASPCSNVCVAVCNEGGDFCGNSSTGTACSTPAAGRNNVCHVTECNGSGTCGNRRNRFPGGSMTPANMSAAYPNVATEFNTCFGCHGAGSSYGAFSFTEGWSESGDYSIFDVYCANWGSHPDNAYYGDRHSGCLLRLVTVGTMPQGNPGGWAAQDEYLQWYCSNNGPGGALFGF